jgi:hypothetical protein
MLLDHSGIKVTEKHYLSWVRARQEQFEADIFGNYRTNGPVSPRAETCGPSPKNPQKGAIFMWPSWWLVEAITADVCNQEQDEQPTYV